MIKEGLMSAIAMRSFFSKHSTIKHPMLGVAMTCAFSASGLLRAEEASRATSIEHAQVILTHSAVPRLAPGIVIGEEQAAGYSDLVTLVRPRLAAGHVDSLPEFSKRYASMFKFTVLANVKEVKRNDRTDYLLDRVGIGFAMDIGGRTVVVTRETANKLGANLGMIDRSVLGGNEDCLDDIVQVARTSRLIIFDAKSNMLVGDAHQKRMIRHLIWASPATGKIGFLVWQLHDRGSDPCKLDGPTMQLLPPGYQEDRQIHVSEGGILSSIPTPDRFAIVTIPQGTPVPMSDALQRVAGKKNLTKADIDRLVAAVAESLAQIESNRIRS